MSRGGRAGDLFGDRAAEYAAARPDYPAELFDRLWGRWPDTGGKGRLALDLAAGTGMGSEALAGRGARVVALDVSRAMLAYARRVPRGPAGPVSAVCGRAESLPLVPGMFDLVFVGQAFHWFEPTLAVDEIVRVLRQDGIAAPAWHVERRDPFLDAVLDLVGQANPGHHRPVGPAMRRPPDALRADPRIVLEPPLVLSRSRELGEDDLVRLARSWSYAGGSLAGEAWLRFERGLRATFRDHHGDGVWAEGLDTVAHIARRR